MKKALGSVIYHATLLVGALKTTDFYHFIIGYLEIQTTFVQSYPWNHSGRQRRSSISNQHSAILW